MLLNFFFKYYNPFNILMVYIRSYFSLFSSDTIATGSLRNFQILSNMFVHIIFMYLQFGLLCLSIYKRLC